MSFLRRQLALPLTDAERVAFRQYQRVILASSFIVPTLFTALADIKKTRAANDGLASQFAALQQKYADLAGPDRHESTSVPSRLSPNSAGDLRPPGEGPGRIPESERPAPSPAIVEPHIRVCPSVPSATGRIEARPTQSVTSLPPALSGTRAEYPICAHMAAKHGGNVAEMGLITITGNSCDAGRETLLPNLINYQWAKCWISENAPKSWVQFEFVNNSIWLTHYSIKTYPSGRGFSHMKSWIVQGYIDGKWTDLDTREDTNELNGRSKTGLWAVANPCEVQTVKITQTKTNHAGDHFMILTNVEFFGVLSDDD